MQSETIKSQSPAPSRGPSRAHSWGKGSELYSELYSELGDEPSKCSQAPVLEGSSPPVLEGSSPSSRCSCGPSPMLNRRVPSWDRASPRTTPVGTPPLDGYTPMLPPMKTPTSRPQSRGSSWGRGSPPLLDKISAPSSAPSGSSPPLSDKISAPSSAPSSAPPSGGSPPLSDIMPAPSSARELRNSSRDSSRESLARTPQYSSAQVEAVDWGAVGLQVLERWFAPDCT